MKQMVKIGFVRAILLTLPLLACSGFIPLSEEDMQEEIETAIARQPSYEDLTAEVEWVTRVAATAQAERLGSGLTFECGAPDNSYVHQRMDTDKGYEESWNYTIHINGDNDTFHLSHEAYSNRTLEQECYDITVWGAQQSGETREDHGIVSTMLLNQRTTRGCEELDPSPAWEETVEEVFEWWFISSPPFDNLGWKINTCTCNANAHQLTAEDIEEFQRTGVCPPCIPGPMLCTEGPRDQ